MKKYVCFLILLLFITGCSYKYDIQINKNKNVSEKIEINELNSIFSNKGTSAEKFIDMNIDIYKNDLGFAQYDISKKISELSSGVIAKASYEKFDDYTKKTKVKKNLFGRVELYEDSGYGYFIANDYRGELFFTDEESDFRNESVDFTLSLPFEVISNNADSMNVENGIYTWHFDNSVVDKDVNIKFNLKKIVVKDNIFVKYMYLFLSPIVLFLLILFILIRNKRVNKI